MAISNNAETFIRIYLRRKETVGSSPNLPQRPLENALRTRRPPIASYPHEADHDEFSHHCPLMGPPFGSAKTSIPLEASGES